MQAERSSAACRAPLCARVIARLRAERGDTLIEVLIGALLVALIATATLGGFADIGHLSETQRNEEQASALAQQDQARLRGLTIAQLSSNGTNTGNWVQPVVLIGGTNYTVTSKSQFISGASGSAACTGSNNADEVQTTSTVTWSSSQGSRNPVVVHGEITPTEGGSLVASVVDPTGAGLAGVTISANGPSSTSPVTTDSSGCVVWAGLASGSYTVSFTPPAGTWIGTNAAAPASQTVNVTATQTTHATQVQIGQAAAIQASFTTTFNSQTVAATSDQFTLSDTGMTPTPQVFGTDSTPALNTYMPNLTTPTSYYPYPSTMPSDDYFAWAGSCTADEPSPAPAGFTITGGQTNPITIPEPAMIILPYSGTPVTANLTYDDRTATSPQVVYAGTWAPSTVTGDYLNTEEHSSTTNSTVTVSYPVGTTTINWITTKALGNGIANVTVDGLTQPTVDLWAASTAQLQTVVTYSGLNPLTSHTLKITVSGTKSHAGTGTGTQIETDKFTGTQITSYTQGPLLTTAPHVIITDTGCGINKDYPPTQVPTITHGALTSPGLPYGTYTVCVDDGTNHVTFTAVKNISFLSPTAATTTNNQWIVAKIYPGGGGTAGSGAGVINGTYATGVCT
jgi:Tfp pilus assembly protein PilV